MKKNFILKIFSLKIEKGYEDVLRHRSDREINNAPIRVLKDGVFVNKKWKDIRVSF